MYAVGKCGCRMNMLLSDVDKAGLENSWLCPLNRELEGDGSLSICRSLSFLFTIHLPKYLPKS